MTSPEDFAVGIDLGTSHSSVAVYRKWMTEVIEGEAGDQTIPSCVAFTDGLTYVGRAAMEVAKSHTVMDSKRLLGRRFVDPEVQRDLLTWPFTVVDDDGALKYELTRAGVPFRVTPEEVSSKILEALRKRAEENVACAITRAVLTVPAYFDDSQRKATVNAGRLAGLEVIGVLNESVAAAIAFGFGMEKSSTALVFSLGGGSLDVSVVKVEGDRFTALAHRGDSHLGGRDLDSMLLDYIVEDIQETLQLDVRGDADALRDLRRACEDAKMKLSVSPQTTVACFLSRHDRGYEKTISRNLFEFLVNPILSRAVGFLPKVLEDAKVKKEAISDVLLVGGSTRIPKLRTMLQDFFAGKTLNKSVSAAGAAATGAAMYAAALTGQSGAKQCKVQDVTSLPLGVTSSDGSVSFLIPRGTPLPFRVARSISSAQVEIKFHQGDETRWQDSPVVSESSLNFDARVSVAVAAFSIDEGGMLSISAMDTSSGEKVDAVVKSGRCLSDEDVCGLFKSAIHNVEGLLQNCPDFPQGFQTASRLMSDVRNGFTEAKEIIENNNNRGRVPLVSLSKLQNIQESVRNLVSLSNIVAEALGDRTLVASGKDKEIADFAEKFCCNLRQTGAELVSLQEDPHVELRRLRRLVQLCQVESGPGFLTLPLPEKETHRSLAQLVRGSATYTTEEDSSVEERLQALHKKSSVAITKEEIAAVFAAMGMPQKHWYTCPNGHPYVVADCGNPVLESRCPECGAGVGGQSHQLRSDNRAAGAFFV